MLYFVGNALVEALAPSHTVYAFSHTRSLAGKYAASVVTKQLDLTDEQAVKSKQSESLHEWSIWFNSYS